MKLLVLLFLVGFASAASIYDDVDEYYDEDHFLEERYADYDELEAMQLDFNLKDIFKKLKKAILDQVDKEKLKEKIEEMFGKGNELADSLLVLLKEKGEKGKKKVLDFIDRILGEKEPKERRSLKDAWEKVKDYFKNLHIDIKEKYKKFGEWVKEVAGKALEKSKGKMENIKSIAREFIDHTKGLSKEVAVEALEFLRPYKDDLGSLWEQVVKSVKEVVGRKD